MRVQRFQESLKQMKKFEKSRNRVLDIEKSWDRSSRHTHTLDEYDWNSYSETSELAQASAKCESQFLAGAQQRRRRKQLRNHLSSQ